MSGKYRGTLVDDLGVLIPASQLTALKLTFYVAEASDLPAATQIINSRGSGAPGGGQDVLQTNGVTIYNTLQTGPDGKQYSLLWQQTPLDSVMKDPDRRTELHIALFEFTYTGGLFGRHLVGFRVENLRRAT